MERVDRVVNKSLKVLYRGTREQVRNWLNGRTDSRYVFVGGELRRLVSARRYLDHY